MLISEALFLFGRRTNAKPPYIGANIMSAKCVKTTVEGNLITPEVPRWNEDRLVQFIERLVENPTHDQVEIYRQSMEDFFGKKILAVSLFATLFHDIIDGLPDLPPMTPKQHADLFSQINLACTYLASKWQDEFFARTEEGFQV